MDYQIKIFTDASRKRVSGSIIAAYAFVIYEQDRITYSESEMIAEHGLTAVECEYKAVLCAMNHFTLNGFTECDAQIFSDCRSIVRQLNRLLRDRDIPDPAYWRRQPHKIKMFLRSINFLIPQFSHLSFNWIPREFNLDADRLARLRIDDFLFSRRQELTSIRATAEMYFSGNQGGC